MLDKVDFTIDNFTDFRISFWKMKYTTYFKLQETLAEMEHSGLLRVETTHNRTLYHLTDNGLDTIQYFKKPRFPHAIQRDIDEFLKEKKYDLKEEGFLSSPTTI